MTTPEDVLRQALTSSARARRAAVPVYLNRRTQPVGRPAAWLSEIGFYAALPFDYAEVDPSNTLPSADASPPASDAPRFVRRIELHLYGAARDCRRLASGLAVDQVVRGARADGQAGRALYPGETEYLGAADLRDDTSVPAKTTELLGAMRAAGSGTAYHAVVTRAGAVYMTAPLDRPVPPGAAPDATADETVAVALEGAGRMRNRIDRDTPEDAPLTAPQLASLAVLVAKLRAAFPDVPLDWTSGLRASPGPEGGVPSGDVWLARDPAARALLLDLVRREPAYDAATQVFRRTPPPASRRGEAQAALGTVDTVGRSSLLLGAYADVAAQSRAGAMREPERTRFFVERARAAHAEGDDALAMAARASRGTQLTTPPPPARNTSPFVYDYESGRWGDEGA